MVNADPTFGERLFNVAVGQAVRKYQRTATVITSSGRRKPANAEEAVDRVIRTSLLKVAIGQRNTQCKT